MTGVSASQDTDFIVKILNNPMTAGVSASQDKYFIVET
jgi:hypothetical protein